MAVQTIKQLQFKQIGALFVSDQGGNRAESLKLLAKNGLRAVTYREALSSSSELAKELKGRCFWLAAENIPCKVGSYTFTPSGELSKPVGNEAPEKKVLVIATDGPMCLSVGADSITVEKFCLYSVSKTYLAASAVVGIRDLPKDPKTKNITEKINDGLHRQDQLRERIRI